MFFSYSRECLLDVAGTKTNKRPMSDYERILVPTALQAPEAYSYVAAIEQQMFYERLGAEKP